MKKPHPRARGGLDEIIRTLVSWRQGFKHSTRNECMSWFAQLPVGHQVIISILGLTFQVATKLLLIAIRSFGSHSFFSPISSQSSSPYGFVSLSYTSVPLIHPTLKLDPYKLVANSSQMTLSTCRRGFES
jgi:hypothetical protein